MKSPSVKKLIISSQTLRTQMNLLLKVIKHIFLYVRFLTFRKSTFNYLQLFSPRTLTLRTYLFTALLTNIFYLAATVITVETFSKSRLTAETSLGQHDLSILLIVHILIIFIGKHHSVFVVLELITLKSAKSCCASSAIWQGWPTNAIYSLSGSEQELI